MMFHKPLRLLSVIAPLLGFASAVYADDWVVTATNDPAGNHLLVYDTNGNLRQTIATGGRGGVSGNSGGIAVNSDALAVVNFGSSTVTVFSLGEGRMQMMQQVQAASSPVSVAFSSNHLYILGTTSVESHSMQGHTVSAHPDGMAALLLADGSAAQVGVLPDSVIISEKNNAIETVALQSNGAVTGKAKLVANIPSNVAAPFGLITRGNNAYISIAHANEVSLVRNAAVLATTGSGMQMAPCWLALHGPFLYSANSPSKSITRFAVFGQKILLDKEVAVSTIAKPTDMYAKDGLLASIDSDGTVTHVSLFSIDEDGNLTLKNSQTVNSGVVNGMVIVQY